MTNHYVKYEDFEIIIFQDNELKSSNIERPCDLELWSGDPKIFRVINYLWPINMWNIKALL
jgi:hypothetical protein